MRAFLAIEITKPLKTNLEKTQDTIRNKKIARIKYVEDNNIHLTLKFFGDIDRQKQNLISKIVNKTVAFHKPYTLKLVKIGAFPNIYRPRVIWSGVKDKNRETINIIKELDEEFSKIGFKKERDYTPHITIGRIKDVYNKTEMTETLKELNKAYHGKMEVTKISLKSSTLTPDGPIYKTEEEFIL